VKYELEFAIHERRWKVMKAAEITKSSPYTQRAKELMAEAFPPDEQLPWTFLKLMAHRKPVQFQIYEDDGKFVGLAYNLVSEDAVYIVFLAVAKEARSHGYGSRIIRSIRRENPGKSLNLNMEPVIPGAENYEQRIRRLAFYEKNGFHDAGCRMVDDESDGSYYTVLTTSRNFSIEKCRRAMGKLTFGLLIPDLVPYRQNAHAAGMKEKGKKKNYE
jgi:GNAT superfamily N-acetyltransferase